MTSNLLIVEDDDALAAQLSEQLRRFGHSSVVAPDGRSAINAVANEAFDAIILDRMLPHVDGISVLQSLRRNQIVVPIIMMTALGRTAERVEGLEAGADDYVVKPVDPAELNARIAALQRARRWKDMASEETIRAGDILISPTRHCAWRNGKALNLPNTEFRLLIELARNADNPVTRAMLLDRVWHYDFDPTTNLVEACVRRLRIRLTEFGDEDPITTVRGVGYMLRG